MVESVGVAGRLFLFGNLFSSGKETKTLEMANTELEVKEAKQEQDWETVEKAAPALRMSPQGLYAAIRERQLPEEAVLRIGRRIRINLRTLKGDRVRK